MFNFIVETSVVKERERERLNFPTIVFRLLYIYHCEILSISVFRSKLMPVTKRVASSA